MLMVNKLMPRWPCAFQSSPEKVNEYIDQFDCYDEEQVCQILLSSPYKMYEEAFRVYDKAKKYEKAVMILLTDIKDMERAIDYGLRLVILFKCCFVSDISTYR
jgi:hypothetical protein